MVTINIKKKPECCGECPCVYLSPYRKGYLECRVLSKILKKDRLTKGREVGCPIKEIPDFNDYNGEDILMTGIAIGWNEALSKITGIRR